MKFLLKAKKLSFIVSFISIKISIKVFYNIYKSGGVVKCIILFLEFLVLIYFRQNLKV